MKKNQKNQQNYEEFDTLMGNVDGEISQDPSEGTSEKKSSNSSKSAQNSAKNSAKNNAKNNGKSKAKSEKTKKDGENLSKRQRKTEERKNSQELKNSKKELKNSQKNAKNIAKIEKKEQKQLQKEVEQARRKANREQQKEKRTSEKNGSLKGAVIGLAIATGVLGLSTIGLAVAYGVNTSSLNDATTQLENVYKKNYYELVGSVNSADVSMSKLLASDSETYQAQMLSEVAEEAKEMQNNIASLPLTGESVLECVKFVNQMAGYTQTLQEELAQGESLSDDDLQTLSQLHDTLTQMKTYLNKMSVQMLNGYSITKASKTVEGDLDEFTSSFANIKSSDSDYPSMIYDGPFSDSVLNAEIVGLTGEEVTRDEAYAVVEQLFKNISSLTYAGQTSGNFDTYNFNLTTTDELNLFVQVTKIGGHLISVSGSASADSAVLDMEQAGNIAIDFAEENGIENAEIVWSDQLNTQAYLNIAPVQDGVVLYPDLVKVKVDMQSGEVIGYDAISYYTNHTERQLSNDRIGIDLARESVDNSFTVVSQRTVLAPLEYNREVLCYEFEANRKGATYYLYYNTASGEQENILKVVTTSDGSKLM